LVEDAAEALGSNVEGKPVGGASVFGAFSLYGNKLITAGEGGMVTSSDAERTERLRFLRDQAMDPKNRYYHPEVGFNYRMTAMQAAFGRVQLERANEFLERKRRLFQGYDERLAGLPLRRNPHLAGQSNPPWLYSVLFDSADLRVRCETALARQEIETRPLFFPLADLPMYRGSAVPCGVARDLRERGLSLPSHPDLTEEQIRRVASVIRSTV
jgi:perosamine synthetase